MPARCPSMDHSAAHYRLIAEDLNHRACLSHDREVREQLKMAARDYERLAREADDERDEEESRSLGANVVGTVRSAPMGVPMTHRRELYRSAPNGDRWSLVQEAGSQRVFIEHEPNASSGGRTTNIEIGDFLSHDGHGPEQQALLRLIGSLVDEPERLATLRH